MYRKGMTCSSYDTRHNDDFEDYIDDEYNDRYSINPSKEKEVRCNPIFVKVVEELGEEANTGHSRLEVFDIPFENTEGWYIEDHHGYEQVHEIHRYWPSEGE